MNATKKIEEHIFKPILPPNLNFKTVIYGEWIQEGTASDIEDKFNYKNREIEVGHFYAFGVALIMPSSGFTEKVSDLKMMLEKSHFSVVYQEKQKFFVLLLNAELIHVFNR